jgi:hypothetical protein
LGRGEVVQGHDRLEVPLAQRVDDIDVMPHRLVVPFPLFRLDARPFDGEAVGLVVQGRGKIEIALVPRVVLARAAGRFLHFSGLLPGPPIVVDIVAFNLVRGGRGSP